MGTNFSDILIKIQKFSFTKLHLKLSSAKWWSFCPGKIELNFLLYVFSHMLCSYDSSLSHGEDATYEKTYLDCWRRFDLTWDKRYKWHGAKTWYWTILKYMIVHPANERRRYIVTTSLVGWAHNHICIVITIAMKDIDTSLKQFDIFIACNM